MAGLIRIDENKAWSAATWAFQHVMRITRKHLPKAEASKILELMDKAEIPGVNYLSLKNLTTREVQILREALERAYQEILILGQNLLASQRSIRVLWKLFENCWT